MTASLRSTQAVYGVVRSPRCAWIPRDVRFIAYPARKSRYLPYDALRRAKTASLSAQSACYFGHTAGVQVNESLKYRIDVSVKTAYLEEQSTPDSDRYVFAYTITIANSGTSQPTGPLVRNAISRSR